MFEEFSVLLPRYYRQLGNRWLPERAKGDSERLGSLLSGALSTKAIAREIRHGGVLGKEASCSSASGLRVLVAPHNFEIGGSQINALELASEVAKLPGLEVALYAPDGELTDRARRLGLDLHLTKLREQAPSPMRIRELSRLARRYKFDIVHSYEWAPTLDAAYGALWRRGIPVLSTILSMDYPYFIPREIPLVMGTQELANLAASEGRKAFLIEPPVDTEAFSRSAVSIESISMARSECGSGAGELLVVVIGRLAPTLKLDGLLVLAEAVGDLAQEFPVKLAIIGDGPARERVQSAAATTNLRVGHEVIRLLGARQEPRPYYLAADIVVGMGSSALRAMALEKPLLVQGERSFWAIADEETLSMFLTQGWFGVGDGTDSVGRCKANLRRLLTASPESRATLGAFGRQVVERRYSLRSAALMLREIYETIHRAPRSSYRSRIQGPMSLTWEIMKYRLSVRFPWLRAAFRKITKR